ncbi:hypothetical protein [Pseudomonas sp. NPDC089741]|uniref:hypothetical protein n=1 Tax=Pseudomonas sp. NPDC089741 TaxID=3364470 RepID=UPI00381721F2
MQRSKPEAMRPDEFRSEGTPSFSEWAERWGKPFWLLLRRLSKVTRRKGGTLRSRYRSNGYVLGQSEHYCLSRHLREQARSHIKNTIAQKIGGNKKPADSHSSAGFLFQQQKDQKSSSRHTS